MRYAIIGDIHGNLEAFEAVLSDIEKQGVDAGACVGDIVGYGAEPSECVAKMRKLGWPCVAGNHDYAVVAKLGLSFFNPYARASILWTRDHLSRADAEYISGLKLVDKLEGITLVHSTLESPEHFNYILSDLDAYTCFRLMETPFCFVGHSHVPVTFLEGERIEHTLSPEIDVGNSARALVNVGSVGQPRDMNPKAAYALFDVEKRSVSIRRVEYDVDSAARKIIAAGLPEVLGQRLYQGA